MTSKIEAKRQGIGAPDGWVIVAGTEAFAKEFPSGLIYIFADESDASDQLKEIQEIRDCKEWQIKPIKIIPHATWERLMEWCRGAVDAAQEDCEEILKKALAKILAEVEAPSVKNLPEWQGAE